MSLNVQNVPQMRCHCHFPRGLSETYWRNNIHWRDAVSIKFLSGPRCFLLVHQLNSGFLSVHCFRSNMLSKLFRFNNFIKKTIFFRVLVLLACSSPNILKCPTSIPGDLTCSVSKNWEKKSKFRKIFPWGRGLFVLVLPALPDKELLPGQRLVVLVEAVLAQVHPDNIQKQCSGFQSSRRRIILKETKP